MVREARSQSELCGRRIAQFSEKEKESNPRVCDDGLCQPGQLFFFLFFFLLLAVSWASRVVDSIRLFINGTSLHWPPVTLSYVCSGRLSFSAISWQTTSMSFLFIFFLFVLLPERCITRQATGSFLPLLVDVVVFTLAPSIELSFGAVRRGANPFFSFFLLLIYEPTNKRLLSSAG